MKKLEIKNIDFGAEDLLSYHPKNAENFCIWLTLTIGISSDAGGTLFEVGVCTIDWLRTQVAIKKVIPLRHLLLVENFDYENIKKTLFEIVKNAERKTIEESYLVLSKNFAWEFEDYQN
jgi:hypothetical protein